LNHAQRFYVARAYAYVANGPEGLAIVNIENPAQPRSMTLMAGPIDTRVNPTKVNTLAKSKPIEWFERHLIARVPYRYTGRGRNVYPGFVQLAAFMSMNIERHVKAHHELYENLANGEKVKAAQTKAFYDEYFAVLDLTSEFYLETVRLVFQDHALPLGMLTYQNCKIEPRAIRRTASEVRVLGLVTLVASVRLLFAPQLGAAWPATLPIS
jgi:polyhydroxyalkanoate depolymerase